MGLVLGQTKRKNSRNLTVVNFRLFMVLFMFLNYFLLIFPIFNKPKIDLSLLNLASFLLSKRVFSGKKCRFTKKNYFGPKSIKSRNFVTLDQF